MSAAENQAAVERALLGDTSAFEGFVRRWQEPLACRGGTKCAFSSAIFMVQLWSSNCFSPLFITLQAATHVAWFQLVTSKCLAVTAFSGSLRNRQAAGGTRGVHKE